VRAFEADPVLFWRLRPGLHEVIWASTLVSTNSRGYRYPREVGAKPAGGVRVLCLGDSVTFGYQVPLVHRDRPDDYDRGARAYPALLESRLSRRFLGRRVEVIPLAVPGYSSHQGRAWLGRDLQALEADAVVVLFGWNDADLRPVTDRVAMPDGWLHRLSRRVVLRSQALIHAANWLRRPAQGPGDVSSVSLVPRVPRDEFVDNHLQMARLAAGLGVPLLVVGPIYRDPVTESETARRMGANRAALKRAMRESRVPYLEVAELTEAAYPGNAGLFIEEVHPSPAGHERLAAAVERGLAEARILVSRLDPVADPELLTGRSTGR
jgi:lysophospholipase L1-like esterase